MITDLNKQGDMIFNHFVKMNEKHKRLNKQKMIETDTVKSKQNWITNMLLVITKGR